MTKTLYYKNDKLKPKEQRNLQHQEPLHAIPDEQNWGRNKKELYKVIQSQWSHISYILHDKCAVRNPMFKININLINPDPFSNAAAARKLINQIQPSNIKNIASKYRQVKDTAQIAQYSYLCSTVHGKLGQSEAQQTNMRPRQFQLLHCRSDGKRIIHINLHKTLQSLTQLNATIASGTAERKDNAAQLLLCWYSSSIRSTNLFDISLMLGMSTVCARGSLVMDDVSFRGNQSSIEYRSYANPSAVIPGSLYSTCNPLRFFNDNIWEISSHGTWRWVRIRLTPDCCCPEQFSSKFVANESLASYITTLATN